MEKFDAVVTNIKSYWTAVQKTVKDVEYTLEWYSPTEKMTCISVSWFEKMPERIPGQIHLLVTGGEQFGLKPYYPQGMEGKVKVFPVIRNSPEGSEKMYSCKVMLMYRE